MNREEALGLLNAYLDQYRKLSYAELAAKIGHEEFPAVVGPSGTEYQMEIQIRWDHKPGGDRGLWPAALLRGTRLDLRPRHQS